MTALSDRIAAQHQATIGFNEGLRCSCDDYETVRSVPDFTSHVADVTERAVRDTIAQQLENLEHTRAMTQDAIFDGYPIQWVEGHDHAIRVATALTREGTTP